MDLRSTAGLAHWGTTRVSAVRRDGQVGMYLFGRHHIALECIDSARHVILTRTGPHRSFSERGSAWMGALYPILLNEVRTRA